MGFFIMKFLEKDLEQIIHESGMDLLNQRGLPIEGKMFRQMKIGNFGIADLMTIERPFREKIPDYGMITHPGKITIYELKKEKISIGAFLQSIKYAKGVLAYLQKIDKRHLFEIKIVLIGKTIDVSGSFCFIPDVISSSDCEIKFYTYKYNIDGLSFYEQHGYSLINEGF